MSDKENYTYVMLVGFGSPLEGHSIFLDAFSELEYVGKMSGQEVMAARDLIDEDFGSEDARIVNGISWRARFNPQYIPIMIKTNSPVGREEIECLLKIKAEEGIEVLREFIDSAKVRI